METVYETRWRSLPPINDEVAAYQLRVERLDTIDDLTHSVTIGEVPLRFWRTDAVGAHWPAIVQDRVGKAVVEAQKLVEFDSVKRTGYAQLRAAVAEELLGHGLPEILGFSPLPPEPDNRPVSRFEKFDEESRQVLAVAQDEAERRRHNYIGTEHLLWALIGNEEYVATRLLLNLQVDLAHIATRLEYYCPVNPTRVGGEIGLTERAKKVVEVTVDECRRRGDDSIATDHILVGILRVGDGLAAALLEAEGATLERVRSCLPPHIYRERDQTEQDEEV